jgi:peptide chain release factor 2
MNYEVIFDIDAKIAEVKKLEELTIQNNFWNDQENAQQIMRQITTHKNVIDKCLAVENRLNDLAALAELAVEEKDESTIGEIFKEGLDVEQAIHTLEFQKMLGKEDDDRNAIFTIHPGAGGTESMDWAQMLMRMYLRWAEKRGFSTSVLDLLPGEEAGLKSVSIEITGEYAYGLLKAEAGIHRLVRISPFDANSRRHTSFASVFVYPEINNEIEININLADLRIDTFRASGAGGQHVNKTSSAIRITHLPTGIVVQCQTERSQHMNKASAMKILMSRLYQKQKDEDRAKMAEIEKTKKDIAWGSQIRSYVFHPYNLVKDHRTKIETSNVQAVMDGELDNFIYGYLLTLK